MCVRESEFVCVCVCVRVSLCVCVRDARYTGTVKLPVFIIFQTV